MHQKEVKKYAKLVIKTVAGFFVFIFFLLYTPSIYNFTVSFFQETFPNERVLIVGNVGLKVQIADTPEERRRGLSGTRRLKEDSGMFFIFDEEDQHGIWMKDMNYPIDIIWFDRFGSVIYIEENVVSETFPEVFKPEKNALYVLEVNAGFVQGEKLKVGDTIDFY